MTKSSAFLVAATMAALALLQPVSGFAAERPNEDVIPRDPQPKTHETGALPPAWQLSGLSKAEYEGGTDKTVTLGGMPSGYIKSTGLNLTHSSTEGFGLLITKQDAQPYRGQTVRFSAQVKTDAVQDHANLFISFASPTQEAGPWRVPTGRFNPKEDPRRPAATPKLSGTTDWTLLALDMDIPADATHVFCGIVLRGRGKAYINRISLDTVAPPSEPEAPALMFGVPR
jgi:hypothetical protein